MLNGQIKDAQNLRRVKVCVQCKKNISCLYDSTESHRHGGRGGLSPPNWNTKHCKSVEVLSNVGMTIPPSNDFLAMVLVVLQPHRCFERST